MNTVPRVLGGTFPGLRPVVAAHPWHAVPVGKLLVVLLAVVVVVEVVAVIVVAGTLFWVGGRGTAAVGASMLVVTLVAGVLAVRAMRLRR